ncbi:winged helix-turn-helix domain-containing protein [Streptosporangium sp. NPDC048047]|uniref:ArsR/SmtB family transcription factor n=1 Tax=Streptosporangium sp. NPDC048047 TaxID=3155748 RepID=UPI0034184740
MIRLHFTEADLRRVTLAPAPDALLEIGLSLRRLRGAPGGAGWSRPAVLEWNRGMATGSGTRAGRLLDLVSSDEAMPAFLCQPDAGDFSAGIERIRRTPTAQLAVDLSHLNPSREVSGWYRELADGDTEARQTLVSELDDYFTASMEPLWPRIRATAAADRALRAETLMRGGVDALLATLGVTCRWEPPVLHVGTVGTYDIPLRGLGLTLVPSYFASAPLVGYRPGGTVTLIYPMVPEGRPEGAPDVLGPLLGRTRAAVLAALRRPATTTALAERTGVSPASASQHAAVLRNAGLVSTVRTGSAVLHTLTPLGEALLGGGPARHVSIR